MIKQNSTPPRLITPQQRRRHESANSPSGSQNLSTSPTSPTKMPQVFDHILYMQGLTAVYDVLREVRTEQVLLSLAEAEYDL